MSLSKISLALIISLFGLSLIHCSHAQDSKEDYLTAHNAARAEVGVPPLTWDDTVASYAQNYANQRIGDCNLVHSGGPYGENIAWGSGDLKGTDAVNMWVGEKPNYDYNSNSCVGGECLHYTQVVWRNSVRLGCAKVRCNSGGTFIGCNYDPPGLLLESFSVELAVLAIWKKALQICSSWLASAAEGELPENCDSTKEWITGFGIASISSLALSGFNDGIAASGQFVRSDICT
ncbi:pathogenesis-related protein 1-like [Fagus crenata]